MTIRKKRDVYGRFHAPDMPASQRHLGMGENNLWAWLSPLWRGRLNELAPKGQQSAFIRDLVRADVRDAYLSSGNSLSDNRLRMFLTIPKAPGSRATFSPIRFKVDQELRQLANQRARKLHCTIQHYVLALIVREYNRRQVVSKGYLQPGENSE